MTTLRQNIKRNTCNIDRNINTWNIFAFNFIGGTDKSHGSGNNKIIIID